MVGELSLGNISIGIVRKAITANSNNPANKTITVIGLLRAERTILIILLFE
jgi:hypothetical protein